MKSGRHAAISRKKARWSSTCRSISPTSWPACRAAAATSSSPKGSSRRKILVYISGPGWTARTLIWTAPVCGDWHRGEDRASRAIVPRRIKFSGSQPQQALDVAAEDLGLVLVAQRDAVHPIGAGLVLDKRVVDREQDAVDPHLHHAAEQRRVGEEAAGGDPEMLAERVAEPVRPGPVAHQGHVDAPQQEGQALTEMAEDDLEPGIGVEHAAQHQPDALRRGLHREAPGGAQDVRVLLDIILVVDIDDRRMWHRRVHVERHVERLGALEDRPEPLVVEKQAAGQPVHHRALETEPGDGAFEL